MNLHGKSQRFGQKQLLTLSGSLFVNSAKYSYGSIKSPPFLSNFGFCLVTWFFNNGLGMFALLCSFQNWYWKLKMGKFWPSYGCIKSKNHAMSVIKIRSYSLVSPLPLPQNDLNAAK